MHRIAIVGGGISGLSAALQLEAQEDVAFELYEASERLGGVLETMHVGPYLIERSADNFATLLPAALELTQEFGNADSLITPSDANRQALVLHRGKIEPLPAGFSLMQPTRLSSILATRTLSWQAKARLMAEYFVPAKSDDKDESLESFATRRLGREVFENLIEPIVGGIFTADPAKLSMKAAMPQFTEMERKHGGLIRASLAQRKEDAGKLAQKASGARYEQFRAHRDGMSAWIEDLAGNLPQSSLHRNAAVQSLTRENNGYLLRTSLGEESFDGVILATPAAATAVLIRPLDAEASRSLEEFHYASSVVVAMVLPKASLNANIDAFGLIVPRNEGRETLAISYTSNKYPGRVPDDQILLRIFFGGAQRPDVIARDDQELLDLAHRELRDILGWNGTPASFEGVIRWNNAMPQYDVGHLDRVAKIHALLDESCPGVHLCGAAYSGVGIPQCVRSGRAAAKSLVSSLLSNS